LRRGGFNREEKFGGIFRNQPQGGGFARGECVPVGPAEKKKKTGRKKRECEGERDTPKEERKKGKWTPPK